MPAAKPYSLKNTMTHPLARMLPQFRWQKQVYRLAEKFPPSGGMAEHAPSWQVVPVVLDPFAVTQIRVNVQRDFWLLALTASASVQTALGGFDAQLYDLSKKVRFADRGLLQAHIGGNTVAPFVLKEPYQFDLPNSQILVVIRNRENAANTIDINLYGQVLRFNQ